MAGSALWVAWRWSLSMLKLLLRLAIWLLELRLRLLRGAVGMLERRR